MKNDIKLKCIHGKEISPDTPLWRYMELSRFMLLLHGKVFIPTLKKLREADPKESLIPLYSDDNLPDLFWSSPKAQDARDWLKEKYRNKNKIKGDEDMFDDEDLRNQLLIREWLDQLSTRRAVWCWASPEKSSESMAMWNLYAKSGVAIRTAFKNVVAALKVPDDAKRGYVCVEYHPQGHFSEKFWMEEYQKKPYIFKNQSYAHEQEVRFVFQIKHRVEPPGIMLDLDTDALFTDGEVVASPYTLPDEADALVEMIKKLRPDIKVRASTELQESPIAPGRFQKEALKIWDDQLKFFKREKGLPDLLREL